MAKMKSSDLMGDDGLSFVGGGEAVIKKAEVAETKKAIPTKTKKDKVVSVKVNSSTWSEFRKLSEMAGSNANNMICQLVARYVMEKTKEYKDMGVL